MTIAKHLKVERGKDYLNVEYENVRLEAKALNNGFYSVSAYELYRQTTKNTHAKGRKITEQPLNVLLDSSESRYTDLWIILDGWQDALTKAQCAELDTIIDDALNGILPPEAETKEEETFPPGTDPNATYNERERKIFCMTWAYIFKNNA